MSYVPQLIATIRKSNTIEVRATVAQEDGRTFVRLRVWVTGADGVARPGRQGIFMRPDQAVALARAILEAEL